jgi:hypothetical protein
MIDALPGDHRLLGRAADAVSDRATAQALQQTLLSSSAVSPRGQSGADVGSEL